MVGRLPESRKTSSRVPSLLSGVFSILGCGIDCTYKSRGLYNDSLRIDENVVKPKL